MSPPEDAGPDGTSSAVPADLRAYSQAAVQIDEHIRQLALWLGRVLDWIVLRGVDSTWWDVESDDEAVLTALETPIHKPRRFRDELAAGATGGQHSAARTTRRAGRPDQPAAPELR
jgi:hypothetical protein